MDGFQAVSNLGPSFSGTRKSRAEAPQALSTGGDSMHSAIGVYLKRAQLADMWVIVVLDAWSALSQYVLVAEGAGCLLIPNHEYAEVLESSKKHVAKLQY